RPAGLLRRRARPARAVDAVRPGALRGGGRGAVLPGGVAAVRRLSPWLCALVAAASAGCFRLTDPFYAFKPLEAGEPPGPGYSLLFGTVEMSPGLFGAPRVDTVVLRQVGPGTRRTYWLASESVLFR